MRKCFFILVLEEVFTSPRRTRTNPQTLMQGICLIPPTFPHWSGGTNGIVKLYCECHLFKVSTLPAIQLSPKDLLLRAIHRILWSIQTEMTQPSKIGYVKWSSQRGIQCIRATHGYTNLRGTCAMKPRADGGVVDKYLNVYGTQNLKIAG